MVMMQKMDPLDMVDTVQKRIGMGGVDVAHRLYVTVLV